MPVTDEQCTITYSCNGSQTEFDVPFRIFQKADLEIKTTDPDGNESDPLALDIDYTVSADNNDFRTGGTVTTTQTYPSGYKITITRKLVRKQEVDYREHDKFPAETVERGVDLLTMITQEDKRDNLRCIKLPISDPESCKTELSTKEQRKGKYLFFDAITGDPVCVVNIQSGTVQITSFAETLLDDADAAAARATLDAEQKSVLQTDVAFSSVMTRYYAVLLTGWYETEMKALGSHIQCYDNANGYFGISLPHGAVVTNLYSNAKVDDGTVTVTLKRCPKTSDMATDMAKNIHSSTGALNDDTIIDATIDNNSYGYSMQVNRADHITAAYLYGVVITYTITQPLP